STSITDRIAARYGCEMRTVLTGFKYIGGEIAKLEQAGESGHYVFGFEESYGYLPGTYVRDTDAVVASLLICEMAAYYRAQGRTLIEVLRGIYATYGNFLHRTDSYTFAGVKGMETMSRIMQGLRTATPKEIAGFQVTATSDYEASATVAADGTVTPITLPKSDIVSFALEGGHGVIVRPSGTEPKIKAYLTAVGADAAEAESIRDRLAAAMKAYLQA
ncbi:MAG: phospho-sugar mutase, partial [Clostridia bacterium]|nr:phospho-sugar mutase [Clostridia bacterium]